MVSMGQVRWWRHRWWTVVVVWVAEVKDKVRVAAVVEVVEIENMGVEVEAKVTVMVVVVVVVGVKEWHSTHAFTFFLRVFPKGRA